MNLCATFSHAVTTLVASLDLKYRHNSRHSAGELKSVYDFHLKHGILFQVESLLSCASTEYDMMYDHLNAIECLNNVYVHFPQQFSVFESNSESIYIAIKKYLLEYIKIFINFNYNVSFFPQSDGYHIFFYSNFETATKAIRVHPLLFNVAINENAFSANL